MKELKPLTIAFRTILLLGLAVAGQNVIAAQTPSVKVKIDPITVPDITVQSEDYAVARSHFHTNLLQKGPAPFQECTPAKPPAGVTEIEYASGSLQLKAWISRPAANDQPKSPAVLFLHGGFCFDLSTWEDSQPFRDAGFVVMTPVLRAENGQPGYYSQFYDEVEDVIAAAEYLRSQPFVDSSQLYIAGHSVGGTLTLLASMFYPHFRAAASFSGSPDAVGYTRHTVAIGGDVPFDYKNPIELQLRSARVYAASFKCPVRIYYGADETHFALSSKPTAELAQAHHLDVQAVVVDGGHNSALASEVEQAIEFFRLESNK
jgi:dienelactone hydrolase